MGHDWGQLTIDILRLVAGGIGFLLSVAVLRALSRQDDVAKEVAKHGKEIRDTRNAISYVAGRMGLDPPDYPDYK